MTMVQKREDAEVRFEAKIHGVELTERIDGVVRQAGVRQGAMARMKARHAQRGRG